MDVRCARCGIEYEFDDALISERGTMVRCTECGHQFRVHPSHVIPAEPDEWRVVAPTGRTIVFRTLRELQQGISQGEVGRDATLLRGKLPPRPLGSIAELDPFFPTRAGADRQQSTLTGVAPPAAAMAPGQRPASSTGKVAVARVGLTTIQVPSNATVAEGARPLGGRKTSLGIGGPAQASSQPSDVPTQKKQSLRTTLPGVSTPSPSPDPEPVAEPAQPQEPAAAAAPWPDKPAPAPAPDKPAAAAARLRASEPPTLRDGEVPRDRPAAAVPKSSTSESASALKAAVVPPRPARKTNPTPATGTLAVTMLSEASPQEPRASAANDNPHTEPPPALRAVSTQISEQSLVAPEVTEPIKTDEVKVSSSHAMRPPASSDDDLGDEGLHLDFRAEAKPMGSPLSSPDNSLDDLAPEPGTFVPTVPPKRLTSAEQLKHSEVARAKSSRAGRWLMLVLLGVLISLGAVFAYHRQVQPSDVATNDSAGNFEHRLLAAREALRTGDLSAAHENLQASQRAGVRDARWLTLTARYDIMRADMNWLSVQVADPADAARMETLKRELSENVTQSLRALKAVESLGAQDPELGAARIDAERLAGHLEQARSLAAALPTNNPPPDIAYALASLELTQQNPRFKEVFDWLGQARAQDSGFGRAPVMLVLACVAGNRMESARAEVQRLKLASRSHPLLAEVESYVRRVAEQAQGQQAPAADSGTATTSDAGAAEAQALADITREGDFRLRLRRAVESLARSELTRSEQLFRSVLAERPKDTEALTGMGDIARRHGNAKNAISYYERVLATNGQYLPALSSMADMKLKTGDRAGATALYRRIVDQVGESPGYGQSAAQHLRELTETAAPKAPGDTEKAPATESSPAVPSHAESADSPGKTQ